MKTKSLLLYSLLMSIACGMQAQPGCPNADHPVLKDKVIYSPFYPTVAPPITDNTTSHDGDRIIYWMHGLQGNSGSWAQASSALSVGSDGFPAYKVFSLNPEYPEFDLDNAAWFVHQQMVEQGDPVNLAINNPDPTSNFIVAHSQGGIVARSVDKMYIDTGLESERRFGGIVTFGSAHQGAQILNNFDLIIGYADAACTELTAGPIIEEILDDFWLDFFVDEDNVLETADVACTFVSEHILPVALSNFTPPITNDYKVGAAPLIELNQTPHTIPMVAVYGIEEEPVLWRGIQYLGIDNPNDSGPWGANDDEKVVESVQSNIGKYLLKTTFWEGTIQLLEGHGLPCTDWWDWVTNIDDCLAHDDDYWRALKLRDNWLRGLRWLTQANDEYKIMIGARVPDVTIENYCVCWTGGGLSIEPLNGECPSGPCAVQTGFSINWIEKPNDGVVLAESAGNLPGADYVIELTNSSHMQMRNDHNARLFFTKLLNGEFGMYFKTQQR